MSDAAESFAVYLGTHTKGASTSRGIYRTVFDAAGDGSLGSPSLVAEATNPTWLAFHPRLPVCYAVGEIGLREGTGDGNLSAYRVIAGRELEPLNQGGTGGPGPCHVAVTADGRHAVVANYADGSVAAFALGDDGTVGKRTAYVAHEGSGPNRKRQEKAHAHSATIAPGGDFVLICDLGADRIAVYRLDHERGTLTPHGPDGIATPPGSGPRHCAFHPSRPHCYVNHELSGTLAAYAWDGEAGTLTPIGDAPTLPADYADADANTTSEVAVHPNGRWCYVGNRGHDTIAVFELAEDGRPEPLIRVDSGGAHPRHFAIDPSGRWMLVANRDSDNLVVFAIDPEHGVPTQTHHHAQVPHAVCVRFAPAHAER